MTELLETTLPPFQEACLIQIVIPMTYHDWTISDVATELGTSERYVTTCLNTLRTELLEQTDDKQEDA